MKLKHDVRTVARQFEIYAKFSNAELCGSGYINDTYCVAFAQAGSAVPNGASKQVARLPSKTLVMVLPKSSHEPGLPMIAPANLVGFRMGIGSPRLKRPGARNFRPVF